MRNVTLEAAIKRQVNPKTAAYIRFLALSFYPPSDSATPAQLRTYWQRVRKSVIEALKDHLSRLIGGRGSATLPDDIALLLRRALEEASTGTVHALFAPYRPTAGRGNTRDLTRQNQIDSAVDYLTLADMRRVADARSRVTVQKAYGVSKRQVYRWLREAGPLSDRSVALEQRFRSRGPASDEGSIVRVITKLMKFSASQYRKRHARKRKA